MAGRRAAKRGLAPVPSIDAVGVDATEARSAPVDVVDQVLQRQIPDRCSDDGAGPVEQGVLDVVSTLSGAVSRPEMVAQARALARTLDDRRLATTHPSANRQLTDVMERLRRSSEPRQGRLARVQAMSERRQDEGCGP